MDRVSSSSPGHIDGRYRNDYLTLILLVLNSTVSSSAAVCLRYGPFTSSSSSDQAGTHIPQKANKPSSTESRILCRLATIRGLGMRKKEAAKATRPSLYMAKGTRLRWTCAMIPRGKGMRPRGRLSLGMRQLLIIRFELEGECTTRAFFYVLSWCSRHGEIATCRPSW